PRTVWASRTRSSRLGGPSSRMTIAASRESRTALTQASSRGHTSQAAMRTSIVGRLVGAVPSILCVAACAPASLARRTERSSLRPGELQATLFDARGSVVSTCRGWPEDGCSLEVPPRAGSYRLVLEVDRVISEGALGLHGTEIAVSVRWSRSGAHP